MEIGDVCAEQSDRRAIDYCAGLVDGEGCISVVLNQSNSFVTYLHVCNTNRDCLDFLAKTIGGEVRTWRFASENRRELFGLRLHGKHAARALLILLPHLIVKRKQAELAIKLESLKIGLNRWNPASQEVTNAQCQVAAELRVLNSAVR